MKFSNRISYYVCSCNIKLLYLVFCCILGDTPSRKMSSRPDVINKNENDHILKQQPKQLLVESRDILSDGSDSDALVIDMGRLFQWECQFLILSNNLLNCYHKQQKVIYYIISVYVYIRRCFWIRRKEASDWWRWRWIKKSYQELLSSNNPQTWR